MYILVCTLMYFVYMRRTLWLLFSSILTVSRRIIMMSLWVPLEDFWYAHPQLFFKCYLLPKNGREPKNSTYKAGPGTY